MMSSDEEAGRPFALKFAVRVGASSPESERASQVRHFGAETRITRIDNETTDDE